MFGTETRLNEWMNEGRKDGKKGERKGGGKDLNLDFI